jgi:hypothetical protein
MLPHVSKGTTPKVHTLTDLKEKKTVESVVCENVRIHKSLTFKETEKRMLANNFILCVIYLFFSANNWQVVI